MASRLSIITILVLIGLSLSISASAAMRAPTELPGTAELFADSGVDVRAAAANIAQASPDNYGLDDTAKHAGLDKGEKKLPDRIGQVIFVLLGLVGVIFLILVIYGGFLWMTAGGNAEQVKKGRDHLTNGAIGVAIILAAYAITAFVFDNLIGTQSI